MQIFNIVFANTKLITTTKKLTLNSDFIYKNKWSKNNVHFNNLYTFSMY